jgi:hypothetical protein
VALLVDIRFNYFDPLPAPAENFGVWLWYGKCGMGGITAWADTRIPVARLTESLVLRELRFVKSDGARPIQWVMPYPEGRAPLCIGSPTYDQDGPTGGAVHARPKVCARGARGCAI